MFEGTEKEYRELFNKYIRRPKVDVFLAQKRKIGFYIVKLVIMVFLTQI